MNELKQLTDDELAWVAATTSGPCSVFINGVKADFSAQDIKAEIAVRKLNEQVANCCSVLIGGWNHYRVYTSASISNYSNYYDYIGYGPTAYTAVLSARPVPVTSRPDPVVEVTTEPKYGPTLIERLIEFFDRFSISFGKRVEINEISKD